MERQNVGPEDAPELGAAVDAAPDGADAAEPAPPAVDPEDLREDPLGGTGGISSGGAG